MWNASLPCPVYRPGARQKGSALILAVLVAGIVASLGVKVAQAFMVDVARIENRQGDMQARQYLLAAEDMASLVLLADQMQGSVDHLQEDWAQVLPSLPTEQGSVQLRIEDAQGRFNLNSLAARAPNLAEAGLPLEQRFTLAQQQFIHLLQGFPDLVAGEQQAVVLTEAIIDWLDEDDEVVGFGGAESLYYISADPACAPANRLFQSVSELKMVRHMSFELYQRLQHLLVVLPEPTALNLNTASWPLLESLGQALGSNPGLALALLEKQMARPFLSLEELADVPSLAQAVGSTADRSSVAVSSHYFLLQARVQQGATERTLVSLLWRGENEVRVLRRDFGSPFENATPWQ